MKPPVTYLLCLLASISLLIVFLIIPEWIYFQDGSIVETFWLVPYPGATLAIERLSFWPIFAYLVLYSLVGSVIVSTALMIYASKTGKANVVPIIALGYQSFFLNVPTLIFQLVYITHAISIPHIAATAILIIVISWYSIRSHQT